MSAAMTIRLIRGRLLGNRWWYHCFQSFHACPAKAKAAAEAEAAGDAEASLYRQFERWMVIHNKVYAYEEEKDRQFMQFREDVEHIHRWHKLGGPPLRLSKLILTGDVPDIFDDAERTHPDE